MMTKAEHAKRILRTLLAVEKAQKAHHAALAAAVAEHGEALGLPDEIVVQSVEPKPQGGGAGSGNGPPPPDDL